MQGWWLCGFVAELNTLGEWKLVAPINGVGLTAHIGAPGVTATFTAAASLLLAAECTADFGTAGTDIDICDTAVAPAVRQVLLGFAHTVGKDSTR